jgi:hypothetical protein
MVTMDNWGQGMSGKGTDEGGENGKRSERDIIQRKLKEIGFTTLEEQRHRLDMIQTYKIVSGKEKVESSTWFQMASESIRTTRQAADPLNLRPTSAKLEVRRNFFSQRVVQDWNKIPSDIKSAHSVESFKKGYAKHRERVV